MKKIVMLLISAVLVAGCQGPAVTGSSVTTLTKPYKDSTPLLVTVGKIGERENCPVSVISLGNTCGDSSGFDPRDVTCRDKNKPEKKIFWVIASVNEDLEISAITHETSKPLNTAPSGTLKNCGWQGNSSGKRRYYECKVKDDQAGDVVYSVTIKDADGNECKLDPTIILN